MGPGMRFTHAKCILPLIAILIAVSCVHIRSGEKVVHEDLAEADLVSEDPMLLKVVCERIACKPESPFKYSLTIDIEEESNDVFRNTLYSLAGLGLPLIVSRSARARLHFVSSRGGEEKTLVVNGRICYYFFLPAPTGLIGTWIGSALEAGNTIKSSRRECLLKQSSSPCERYMNYLRDSIEPTGGELNWIFTEGKVGGRI